MKKNVTKKALISSLVSLLLCVSMLVGTTYAWFTDSVTSANNIITAGNLDIELEYLDATGNWQTVNGDTNVFMENALWEPGHTEVVYLKISNAGSLAFNYKLSVNIYEEVGSTNVYGEEFRLSSYIMMGAVDGQSTKFVDRATAVDALDANAVTAIKEGYAAAGTLYAANDANMPADGASEKYLALVVYMPETVGNEANYMKGYEVPTIKLGINLLATQKTHESDGFNNQYDAGANTATPEVPVEKVTIPEVTVYDIFGAEVQEETLYNVEMDIYTFIAEDYQGAYPVETYGDWYCDYFVSTESGVDSGIALIGNYANFGWLGFWAPANDVAYTDVGLLGLVGNNLTYTEVCNDVQVFQCGLVNYNAENVGINVTVELRMTNPQDDTDVITVRSITVPLTQIVRS